MPEFSANLGYLWKDLPTPDAIRAAKAAGFHAVECHTPYDTPAGDTLAALTETGLPMLAINTRRGGDSEVGLAALPGREAEARAHIDEAIAYAAEIKATAVHVLAGTGPDTSQDVFMDNLSYASSLAAREGMDILIEPLSHISAPDYHLTTSGQAANIITRLALPNVKMMFDCFHIAIMEGDVLVQLHKHLPLIGHIQFASVPERLAPGKDGQELFAKIDQLGWKKPFGAEYNVTGRTEDTLGWMTY